jgi:inner membrane protein
MLLWSALSLLPDADAIGFRFGIRYGEEWGHRGATHSLAFAAAVGLVAWLVAPLVRASGARAGVFAFGVVASHPLLDSLTTGGLGCALFWPFDLTRYFAPWRLIPVAPIGLAFFSARGVAVAFEELMLFLPCFIYALWPQRRSMGMPTRPLTCLLLLCVALAAIVGCGGESTSHGRSVRATEQGGAAATERSSGGAAATRASAGDAAAASGTNETPNACPDMTGPGSPITEGPPAAIGCYVGVNGLWHAVPCECDLWVDSPLTSDLRASISLSFLPTDLAPSFDGDIDVEMTFPDASATWFDIWQLQATRTTSFAVTHSSEDGTTMVRLGQSKVTLDPVPLAACESRRPRAAIRGPWGTALRLDLVATLTDASGNAVTTSNNYCEQPASHPTPF